MDNSALRRALCVAALASVPACASAGDRGAAEQERSQHAAIVGGYLDTDTHGVVALAVKARATGKPEVFCSGSLLAPNVVLTARHCIAQIGDGTSEEVDCPATQFTSQYDPSQIFVSIDAQPQVSNSALYPVSQILQAPGSTTVCGFDVALLVLSGAGVPSAKATPIVPVLDAPTTVQTKFSAVGYGLQNASDTKGTTAGSRMRFDSAEVYCVGTSCPAAAQNTANEWVGNSPVCSGDSGGPALDAAGRVFGVTSRGDAQCSYALYSNVADWADFIRSTTRSAAASAGYPAPAWANAASAVDAGTIDVDASAAASDGGSSMAGAGTGGSAGTNNSGSAGTNNSGSAGTAGASSAAAGGTANTGAPVDAGMVSTTPPPVQSATPTVDPLGEACSGDCPGIYQCYSATGSPPGVCVPPCTEGGAACPADYSCSANLKVCVPAKEVVAKGTIAASCSLRSSSPHRSSSSWTLLLALGCAWLVRRRRTAA